MNTLRSQLHRRKHDESGAAAVEFALISVVLFMLIFGIIEFGQFYSQHQVFQGAAREGARLAAVRQPTSAVLTRITQAADPYDLNGKPGVTVAAAGSSGPTPCHTGNIGQPVTVRWRQVYDIQLPFVPAIKTRVWVKSVFKCE